jgi:uncharacterized phosphatase
VPKQDLTVAWVRHGETDWNVEGRLQGRQDIPLNGRGRDQARSVGRYLAPLAFHLVFSSPLARARETAEIIAGIAGLQPPLLVEDLTERDYGQASGLTADERMALFGNGTAPGVESLGALRHRVRKVLSSLERQDSASRLIVVAHGGSINAMLSLVSQGELGTGKTQLNNGSVSITRCIDSTWEIQSCNVTVPNRS